MADISIILQDESVQARLMAKIAKDQTGCWLWTGTVNQKGYGIAHVKGVRSVAHRMFYQMMVGDIPGGLVLDHLCRVRNCVNPDHLEPVTNGENVRRGIGPSVIRALAQQLTHCKNGHEWTLENTRWDPRGVMKRTCKTCQRRYRLECDRRRRARAKTEKEGLKI